MYAQVAIKPNPLLRNGAYGIVMRGVQKCTRGCSSLRGRNKLPLCCIKLDTATDPCMGSGHILIAMFDVLMDIYESAGYDKREAAFEIVEHNIHGLDIDQRAYQLAYFAVMMKGRGYNRRFLRGRDGKPEPKVYAIVESNEINRNHMQFFGTHLSEMERNLAVMQIEGLLDTFKDAREYGSILNVDACDWNVLERFVDDLGTDGQISFESVGSEETQEGLRKLVRVARNLGQKYDAVVTNPPYMGASGMGAKLSKYVKDNYPDSKSDLFAVFIEKCGYMAKKNGYQAMITQHAWMFLSSFEKLRNKIQLSDIVNMAHLGPRAFEEIGGEVVQTTSFVIRNSHIKKFIGTYCRLIEPTTQQGKEKMFFDGENRYYAEQESFDKIPGNPVAYWFSQQTIDAFDAKKLYELYEARNGITTGQNDLFIRYWYEVEPKSNKWFRCNKGGSFRKWYGNHDYVIDWENEGFRLKNFRDDKGKQRSTLRSIEFNFVQAITMSRIGSGITSFRLLPKGFITEGASNNIYVQGKYENLLGFLNSKVCDYILDLYNPTINVMPDDLKNLPLTYIQKPINCEEQVNESVAITKEDWNSFETSWDFKRHPLLPNNEPEGITTLFGVKIGAEKWIKKLYEGSACFSPVGDFIVEGETTGNNEQGDKFEGVFARLKKDNPLIEKMSKKLGEDLEKIVDGEYILLRRKSCRDIPVLCLYGMYKEDAREIDSKIFDNGVFQSTLQFQLSDKMYNEFLNGPVLSKGKIEPWSMGMSLGHFQNVIENELDKKGVQYKAVKINYDLFKTDEFFVEPTENYDELCHKSVRLNYQKEVRWILSNIHQKDKFILPYSPLSKESVGVAKGKMVFKFDVVGHIKEKVSIASCFNRWDKSCNNRFEKLKQREEELNRIFIDIYGLQDELIPEVEDKDITVRKADLSRDIRSFISYAVGCMFGRYSLDEEGLIYAGGEWDNSRYQTFLPDDDNCIPITDEEYFADDIVERFVEFVKTVYGVDTLEENLDFIANALGNKGDTSREVIRNYFLKDFYADHLKVYQKRPIYWLFDSGKQNGFKALIYMHRYDADTVGRVRTDYLHRAQKYVETAMQSAQYTIDNASSASEKSKATKAVTKYTKQLAEMKIYDEAIAHIANKRIEIDLDDGVKVNYEKFQGVEVAQEGKKALKVDLLATIK